MTEDFEVAQIAIEHALWAAGQDLTARDLTAFVGIRWPGHREPSWHDAVQALIWCRHRLPASPNPQHRRVA